MLHRGIVERTRERATLLDEEHREILVPATRKKWKEGE
jgi:hypothetical protein